MTAASRQSATTTVDRDALTFVVERVFAAPRARVFRAFASCEALSQWWSPGDWTVPECEQDFRAGGTWLYLMRGPDGTEAWGKQTYLEIVEPERIVAIDEFTDASGTPLEGMPTIHTTFELIDEAGSTRLRNTARFDAVADLELVLRMGMEEGMTMSWDKLEAFLA